MEAIGVLRRTGSSRFSSCRSSRHLSSASPTTKEVLSDAMPRVTNPHSRRRRLEESQGPGPSASRRSASSNVLIEDAKKRIVAGRAEVVRERRLWRRHRRSRSRRSMGWLVEATLLVKESIWGGGAATNCTCRFRSGAAAGEHGRVLLSQFATWAKAMFCLGQVLPSRCFLSRASKMQTWGFSSQSSNCR